MSITHIFITLGVAFMAALAPTVKAEPERGGPSTELTVPSISLSQSFDAMPVTVEMSTDPDSDVVDPGGDEIEAEIEIAFCFINATRAKPNENIYAKNRDEAKKKAHREQAWCHDGPCQKTEASEENCVDW